MIFVNVIKLFFCNALLHGFHEQEILFTWLPLRSLVFFIKVKIIYVMYEELFLSMFQMYMSIKVSRSPPKTSTIFLFKSASKMNERTHVGSPYEGTPIQFYRLAKYDEQSTIYSNLILFYRTKNFTYISEFFGWAGQRNFRHLSLRFWVDKIETTSDVSYGQ